MTLPAGTAYVDILPRIGRGFGSDIERGISGDIDSVGEKAGSRIGGLIKGIAIAAAGAFALDKVKDFVSGSITAASDLNETLSKSSVIFGQNSADLEQWASKASTTLGLSKKAALDAASGFGDMFSQIGFTGKQAAGMSKDVVQLATDLGSFNNLDTDQVLDMISGSLRGEFDSLQRVIPNINAARVQQEAMAATGKKNADQLTAQEKAAATLAIIHKDGARAAGDFARTSGGLANQQRILSARMEDVKARVGQALLPIMLKLTTAFSNVLGPAMDKISIGFHAFKEAFSGEGITSNGWVGALERIGVFARMVIEDIKAFIYTLRTGFTEDEGTPIEHLALLFRNQVLPIIREVVGFVSDHLVPILIGVGIVIAAIAAPVWTAIAALVFLYVRFQVVRDIVAAVVAFFTDVVAPTLAVVAGYLIEQFGHLAAFAQQVWPQIQEAVEHTVHAISDIIEWLIGVVSVAWSMFGDNILKVAQAIWNDIRALIEFVVGVIENVIRLGLAIINGDWGKAWDAIKGIFGAAWDFIVATAKNLFEILLSLFRIQLDAAKAIFSWAIDAIIQFFKDLPGNLVAALKGLGEFLGNAWKWELETGWHIAVAAFGLAIQFFKDLPGNLVSWIGDLAGILGRFYKWQFETAWNVGKAAVEAIVEYFRALPGRLAEIAGDVFGFLRNAFRSAINWIIDRWNSLEFKVPGIDEGPLHFGGFTIGMPNIPRLHQGGQLLTAGLVNMRPGEEIVALPRGAAVAPLNQAGALGVHKTYQLNLHGPFGNDDIDIAAQFRRMELLDV